MNSKTKVLAEAGAMIALAQVLSYVVVFQMPQGGSVTAGSMIPILIFAIRWGAKKGLLAGAVYGILQFILGPKWSFHPISVILEYPVAFGLLGLAGWYRKNITGVVSGIAMGIFGRFVCHVIAGVVVFASFAPEGQSPLEYSVVYNGSYLLPELVISVVIIILMHRLMKQYLIIQN